ncbi:MAG: acyltransferase family protein [Leptolyngbya sp. SIO1D8]|nr:acyltransferase family protein [Leptolyngbya sp. SIO1D8]
MSTGSKTRLVFMDNLRVLLTALVVAHHAAQPYGPTGGEWPIFNPERAAILGPFFAVNAAFFMGLFFFISGYFLPPACDRKGVKRFLQNRLQRLGIPVLFFVVIVIPPILYILVNPPIPFLAFFQQVYIRERDIEFAHLWFLMHLLGYAIAYGLWRRISPRKHLSKRQPPGHLSIIFYVLGLSLMTFLVRIEYPIDRWVKLLWILPIELAHFPQYCSLFVLGIIAYRQDWVWQMPKLRGWIWLGVGMGAGALRYLYSLMRHTFALPDLIAGGGFNGPSYIWSLWEATICVGLCIGLLTLFRERLNFQSKLMRVLSANAYGVYLIHLLVVIFIQLSIAILAIAPLAKFVLVMLIGTPICFALTALLRKIPFVKFVIS